MIRVILFLLTNMSVMFMFGTVLFLTGIESHSIKALIILSGIVGFSGSITSLLLSKWSSLKSVNGRIIHQPKDKMEAWILATVKNQSDRLGIKTPQVAIYDTNSVNAFATGHSRNSSLIALSTGLLKNMHKKNVHAVIAHELSHIANGDMITLSLIQGTINTFVFFISNLTSRFIMNKLSHHRSSNYVRSYGFLINYVISMILQAVFGMLASIIVMGFSRYREFKADADAAKRIGWNNMIELLETFQKITEPKPAYDIETYCIRGQSKSFLNLFSSHPPMQDRIDALYNKLYK